MAHQTPNSRPKLASGSSFDRVFRLALATAANNTHVFWVGPKFPQWRALAQVYAAIRNEAWQEREVLEGTGREMDPRQAAHLVLVTASAVWGFPPLEAEFACCTFYFPEAPTALKAEAAAVTKQVRQLLYIYIYTCKTYLYVRMSYAIFC